MKITLEKTQLHIYFHNFDSLRFQVHISLAIIFAMHGFLPSDPESGMPGGKLSVLPFLTFLLSLFSSSFGLSKFLLTGPIPFLPKDPPLAGMISLPFFMTCLVNLMFGVRIFVLEHSFFTSYRLVLPPENYDHSNNTQWMQWAEGVYSNRIDPIIAPEYRLKVFLIPSLISVIGNSIRLSITTKGCRKFFLYYPQYIIMPAFSPITFEGTSSKSSTKTLELRIWKLGTFLNGLFIGVLPQIILISSDIIRGVTEWNFLESNLKEGIVQNSDTIMKHRFGNIIFSVISIFVFSIIFILLLKTDKLFVNKGLFCHSCKMFCCSCTNPCLLAPSSNPSNITHLLVNSKDLKPSPETIELENPSNNIEEPLEETSMISKEQAAPLPESIKQI